MSVLLNPLVELNVFAKSSKQALNKPLMVLLALGLLSQGKRTVSFVQIEEQLKGLLREFGGGVRHPRPDYPFWRLQNDGIWTVTPSDFRVNKSGDVPVTALRDREAEGQFRPEVLRWLSEGDGQQLTMATQQVLDAYFPNSLHEDLLAAIGFEAYEEATGKRRRNPSFRSNVLTAYRLKCAVCAQDLRIGSTTIALEAAHIKWHQAGGPDEVANGLCLCSTHHKLFDLGAFTIDGRLRLLVSEYVTGAGQLKELLLRHHGREISKPIHREHYPRDEHLLWHRQIVFKGAPLPC